jgi:oligopeptide transport system substrate-binding protein
VKGWAAALVMCLSIAVNGCSSSSAPKQLAQDQTLRLVAASDIQTLDPARIHQPTVELSLIRNVFGGLYQFNNDLSKEEPDIAISVPDVTADGLTWTFHLRPDARFSNGDPVTAADVLFSWNRSAAQNEYGGVIFDHVRGYSDVADGRVKNLAGLSAADDHTVVASLDAPAGWWLTELGMWPAYVVEQRVVEAGGDRWWSTGDGLVGTGPFKLTRWTAGRSLDFEPLPHWWRGSTGSLKHIHADVIADQDARAAAYTAGQDDIVGYLPSDPQAPEVSYGAIKSTPRSELYIRPWLASSRIGYPMAGRLGSDVDTPARRALSLALDRTRLADDACQGGITCMPATGGLIAKGLAGYLGDGADPNAKHDIAAAKGLVAGWDPDGSRLKHLRVGAPTHLDALAHAVTAQWQTALGLDVSLQVTDFETIRNNAIHGLLDVTIIEFVTDYDSPRNWLQSVNPVFCNFENPQFRTIADAADKTLPGEALADYVKAEQLLADSAACAALVYGLGIYLIHQWVQGAGGNALFESYWTGISILAH